MLLCMQVPLGFHWLLCIAVLLHLYCSSAIIKNELSSTKLRAAKRVAGFVVVFVVMWAPEVRCFVVSPGLHTGPETDCAHSSGSY